MKAILRLALGLTLLCAPQASAQTDYTIGGQDVLTITVYDQADLSGKFTVDPDGTLTFPLLGRVKAGGPDPARARRRISRSGWPTATSAIRRSRSRWRRIGASRSS